MLGMFWHPLVYEDAASPSLSMSVYYALNTMDRGGRWTILPWTKSDALLDEEGK